MFELKVLNKQLSDQIHCRLTPTPSEDFIIGTIKIDLSILLNGTSYITGCFDVVDFSGRLNGQLKLKITPNQNIVQYRQIQQIEPISSPTLDPTLSLLDATGLSCSFLSGALKRKFTELEEITQRLKSRLQDVTDEENHDSVDDEFENDLNTVADEDEDSSDWPNFEHINLEQKNKFSSYKIWNNSSTNNDGSSNETLPSTSASTSSSSISITQERVKFISDNLKKATIDDESK